MFFRNPATFACTSICWNGRKSAAIVSVSARSRRSALTTATVVRGSPDAAAAAGEFEHAVAAASGTTAATAIPYSSLPIGSVFLMNPLRASRGCAGRPQSPGLRNGLEETGWRGSEAVRRSDARRKRQRRVGRAGGSGEVGREFDDRLRRAVSRRDDDDDGRVLLWHRGAAVRPAEPRVLLRRRSLILESIVRTRDCRDAGNGREDHRGDKTRGGGAKSHEREQALYRASAQRLKLQACGLGLAAQRAAGGGASGYDRTMFTPTAIGVARTPFAETRAIPKGPGAKHDAIGTLEIFEAFAIGLTDIEGFSHLYV